MISIQPVIDDEYVEWLISNYVSDEIEELVIGLLTEKGVELPEAAENHILLMSLEAMAGLLAANHPAVDVSYREANATHGSETDAERNGSMTSWGGA